METKNDDKTQLIIHQILTHSGIFFFTFIFHSLTPEGQEKAADSNLPGEQHP